MTEHQPKERTRRERRRNPVEPGSERAARLEQMRAYINARDARLNQAAQRAGYETWAKLETAVANGAAVNIPAGEQ